MTNVEFKGITFLVLFASLLLSSCGNSSGSGRGQTQPLPKIGTLIGSDFAGAGSIDVMTILSDGSVESVPGSPFAANGPADAVVASASSNLVFVASSTGLLNGSLSAFTISANGALSSMGPPTTTGIVEPLTLSLTSNGSFLLVGNGNFSPVIFSVNTTTGSVSELTNLGATGPSTFSPDGKLILFVDGSQLNSYSFNGSTDIATLISSAYDFFETIPTPPIVHPSVKFVYVPYSPQMTTGVPPPGGIAAFALATDGTLSAIPGTPFASGINFGSSAGTGFSAAVIDPTGTHLYAESATSVYGFAIDSNSGVLTPIAGANPFDVDVGVGTHLGLVFDSSGRYLFVSRLGAIWSYSIASDGLRNSFRVLPLQWAEKSPP
jgi:hypothetical protein